ncbi:ECF transporter S component [Thermoproteota archaeon]
MSLYKQKNVILISSGVAALVLITGAVIQIITMLRSVGVTTLHEAVSLESSDKVNFALYLTLAAVSFALIIWADAFILKESIRSAGVLFLLSAVTALSALLLPFYLGYQSSTLGAVCILIGLALMGFLGYMALKTPVAKVKSREAYMSSREIAVVAVFSALTAVITGTTGLVLPSPTGGYTHVGDTAIYVAALLFGAKVGGLVGVIGPVAADILVGYPRWFVTVLAHGTQGYIAGLGKGRGAVSQVLLLALSGFVMATCYFFVNIFIKGYPLALISFARDLFGQSLVSIILGLILTKAAEKTIPNFLR